jgi:uncharacterized protein YdeI (YjbR/CyaY-like superfamily)
MTNYQLKWENEIEILKMIIGKSGLTGTIKWGIDVYTYKGKNVVGVAGFKAFFALWFYNGVFLKDEAQVLINASESTTKALRQWRFKSASEINEELILQYLQEAVLNEDAGMVMKPEKKAMPPLPELLQQYLDQDEDLKQKFLKLPPYKQKDYINYIGLPKREETRIEHLEQSIPLIMKGLGIMDKYK